MRGAAGLLWAAAPARHVEIEELDDPVVGDEEVLGRDVSVHCAEWAVGVGGGVHGGERDRRLPHHGHDFVDGQDADALAERATVHAFEHEHRWRAFDEIDERDHVGMMEAR